MSGFWATYRFLISFLSRPCRLLWSPDDASATRYYSCASLLRAVFFGFKIITPSCLISCGNAAQSMPCSWQTSSRPRCGASYPASVVDGVDGVLVRLDEVNVALILLLGAQVELAILFNHF